MITREQLKTKLEEILVEHSEVASMMGGTIPESTPFRELDFDSLDLVELVMSTTSELSDHMPDPDAFEAACDDKLGEEMTITFKDWIDFVQGFTTR